MSDAVERVLELLELDQLEVDLFRGFSKDISIPTRVFGGQVIAQALVAAYRTVDIDTRACHSLHGYFIRAGDPSRPIIYEVDRARDGGSFTTRRVVAIQNGKQIFNLAASFHRQEEGWSHQHDAPEVEGPEGLLNREQIRAQFIDEIPENRRAEVLSPRAIEIRELDPVHPLRPEIKSDRNHTWIRIAKPIDAAPWLHHCLLAYASDMSLLASGNRPHAVTFHTGDLMGVSLDHALWFHGPLKFDEWHLYTMDSPYAGGARSFTRGSIYSQDGRLVASVAQEGLMRPIKRKED